MTTVYHFLDLNEIVDKFFTSCQRCTQMEWSYDFLGGFWTLNSTHPSPDVEFKEDDTQLHEIVFGRKTDARIFDLFYVGESWKTSAFIASNTKNSKNTRHSRRRGRSKQDKTVQVCEIFWKPMSKS